MFTLVVPFLLATAAGPASPILKPVQPNDNLQAAGHLGGGVLRVRLFADVGTWHPEGVRGPARNVAAGDMDCGDR